MFVIRLEQYFNFCVTKRMVAMVNDLLKQMQISSKSHTSFYNDFSILILNITKTRGSKGLGLLI